MKEETEVRTADPESRPPVANGAGTELETGSWLGIDRAGRGAPGPCPGHLLGAAHGPRLLELARQSRRAPA